MLLVVDEHEEEIDEHIKGLVLKDGFFSEVTNMQGQLQLSANTLDSLQSDSSTMADAYEFGWICYHVKCWLPI